MTEPNKREDFVWKRMKDRHGNHVTLSEDGYGGYTLVVDFYGQVNYYFYKGNAIADAENGYTREIQRFMEHDNYGIFD